MVSRRTSLATLAALPAVAEATANHVAKPEVGTALEGTVWEVRTVGNALYGGHFDPILLPHSYRVLLNGALVGQGDDWASGAYTALVSHHIQPGDVLRMEMLNGDGSLVVMAQEWQAWSESSYLSMVDRDADTDLRFTIGCMDAALHGEPDPPS